MDLTFYDGVFDDVLSSRAFQRGDHQAWNAKMVQLADIYTCTWREKINLLYVKWRSMGPVSNMFSEEGERKNDDDDDDDNYDDDTSIIKGITQ